MGDMSEDFCSTEDIWHDEQVDVNLNITHNLGEMAGHVTVEDTDLYNVLWRPYRLYNIEDNTDESYSFMAKASELESILFLGLKELKSNPEKYKAFNPDNGWGDYEGLVKFCEKYLVAINRYPNARIEVSR